MPNKVSLGRLEARPSSIHGKGLFTRDTIRRGALIGIFEGPPAQRDSKFLFLMESTPKERWPGLKEFLWGNWWKGVRVTNILKYANHSASPNSQPQGRLLYATRRIQPGEEITWDYGPDWRE